MDLINVIAHIWNIFLLFLFFLPGAILECAEINNTKVIKKTIDYLETKISTTGPFVFPTTTKSPKTIMAALTEATAVSTPTTIETLKCLYYEQNSKNYTTNQETQQSHYKEVKDVAKNIEIKAYSSHNLVKSNMTTALGTIITTKLQDELQKQEQHSKLFATDFKNNSFRVQEHFQPIIVEDSMNDLSNKSSSLLLLENIAKVEVAKKENLSNSSKKNSQNSLITTSTTNPFVNYYKDPQTLGELTMSNSISNNMIRHNKYDGSSQAENTGAPTIKSLNKSHQTTAVLTTASITIKPLETKQNSLYDSNSALSFVPYKSAALKASAPVMKILHNNLNILSSSSRFSTSSLKGDTLLSLPGIIAIDKSSVNDRSSMKTSSSINEQDTDDVENILKTQYDLKNNNSLAHEYIAINQTFKTTVNITPTTTTLAINETSSSLPFNISPTYSVITTEPTKKTSTIAAALTTTSPSKATLKPTTRRRKISTTTLKPPPTIDDYQTITSQAGTHAYLPCNVKQLVKKPISWLRVRDGHILTVDQTTFIADQRFQSVYTVNPERWSLQIKYVQLKDAGIYECQVSTEPKASALVYLHVVEPKTELIGAPTRHVKAGSKVKLLCIISQALEPPLFINWFYNQKQIYLHNRKGWYTEIERIELPPETTTTTTSTTTTTAAPTITTTLSSTLVPSSLLSLSTSSTTSSSTLNGSESSVMHVFTSVTPQQSLVDGTLLELVSESTYNNYPNFKQSEAVSMSNLPKTQQIQTTTLPATTAASTSTITSMPEAQRESTTTLSFDDITEDFNDNDKDDYKTNPSTSNFDTAEAIAAGRGYMMLSSLMTFTDVKQITTASLIIPSVQKQDSGNYTCSPSNSEPRTVILHVLNGEYSASAITSAALNLHVQLKCVIFNLSIFTLINSLLKYSVLDKQHIIKRYNGG